LADKLVAYAPDNNHHEAENNLTEHDAANAVTEQVPYQDSTCPVMRQTRHNDNFIPQVHLL
jgi:hypothetical protein